MDNVQRNRPSLTCLHHWTALNGHLSQLNFRSEADRCAHRLEQTANAYHNRTRKKKLDKPIVAKAQYYHRTFIIDDQLIFHDGKRPTFYCFGIVSRAA